MSKSPAGNRVILVISLQSSTIPLNTSAIVVEQIYDAPIAVVWKAITDKDQMQRWFFEPITDFKPEVGFETRFDVQVEGWIFPHLWRVTDVLPNTRITYDWRYGGYSGNSSVNWELVETKTVRN